MTRIPVAWMSLALAVWIAAAGCASEDARVEGEESAAATSYAKGVDVSEALYAQDKGVIFKDTNGKAKAPLEIFKSHGYTWARCRLMVNGTSEYALFQDLAYVKRTALAAKAQGMKLLLDLHYSHWWADPGNQWTPPAWRSNSTPDALAATVYAYTRDVMAQLVAQGTPPAMVQIGNEVNDGMLWETGRRSKSLASFVRLQVAGARGVRDGRGGAAMPPIMVHIAKTGSPDETVAWYRSFINAGGWVDAIGLSYYPMWHGDLTALRKTIAQLRSAFSWAPVYVVETAYYWDQGNSTGLSYPHSPAGQAAFLAAVRSTVINAGGSGVFYWGAFWSQTSRWLNAPGWSDEPSRRALFNDSAAALSGIDSL